MWLGFFYVFAGLCIVFVLGFMKFVSRSRFRDEDGDITTEVGFEEDPVGNVKKREYQFPTQEELEEPHMGQEKPFQ